MQIDFVIHGVPQGHQIWGTRSDKYYESFYDKSDIYGTSKMVFVVEVRDNNGLRNCYYSLIRPQNILAASGRPGSYFGMSIRVEGNYCTDVYSLFNLFELSYNQFIAKKILVKNGESEQYAIESFESKSDIFSELSKYILSQIQTHLSSEFEEIDNSFTKKNAQITDYYHPDDVNSEAFFNATKVDGRVIISSDYPTKDSVIKNLRIREKQLQDAKKNDDELIKTLQNENDSLKPYKQKYSGQLKELEEGKIEEQKLRTSLNEATKELSSLRHRVGSLTSQLDQLKNASNIRQIANNLEKSMSEMLPILRNFAPEARPNSTFNNDYEDKGSNKKGLSTTIIVIIVILIILLCLFFFGKGLMGNKNDTVAQLEKENMELNIQYENLQKDYSNLEKRLKAQSGQIASFESFFTTIYPGTMIDFSPYNGNGDLSKDKIYTATLKGGYTGDNGEWDLEGLEETGNSGNNVIKVKPKKAGPVKITYKIGGQTVKTREFNVK